jgi:hypothetical protein
LRREWGLHLHGRRWRWHWRWHGRERRRRMHALTGAVVPGGMFSMQYRVLVLKGREMNTVNRNALSISSALAILLFPILAAADCSSSSSCIDCTQNRRQIATCTTVTYSASCSCSLNVATPESCILEGACSYTAGGGTGGNGGAGGGGGGATCYTSGGQWCPPECSSCTSVFWN